MKNAIPIGADAEYSLEQLSDILRILLSDAQDAYFEVEDLQIPRDKLFDIIYGLFEHISQVSLGAFALVKCSPGNYQVIYRENAAAPQRDKKQASDDEAVSDKPFRMNPKNAAITALRLEEMTGHLPFYAKQEPYAQLVADLRAKKEKKSN